tara:strand:+ start:295 stop:657 length:363 start_codon:yes stop_codon:yes gene_type:complete
MEHTIFVYGTLRTGESRNHTMRDADYLGVYKTIPKYTMYNLGAFPCITFGGKTSITGDVFKIDDYTLDMCDMIEGHPDFYTRMPIELLDKSIKAEAYFMNDLKGAHYTPILSGNWFKIFA